MTYVVPDRRDLFDRARATYAGVVDRVMEYRALAGVMQNPGAEVSQEQLEQFYTSYMELRTAIVNQLGLDMTAADSLVAETMASIQESRPTAVAPAPAGLAFVAVPPPPGGTPVGGALALPGLNENQLAKPDTSWMPEAFGHETQPYKHPPLAPWQQAIEQIGLIETILEQLPDRAGDFVASVRAKLSSMREWIERKHFITDKMGQALNGMQSGAERWLEGSKERPQRRRR